MLQKSRYEGLQILRAIACIVVLIYHGFAGWFVNQNWDIGLAPLMVNEFNECKSAIKIMDYAACELTIIASPQHDYLKSFSPEHGIHYVENNAEKWFKSVSVLVDDIKLRSDSARKKYAHYIKSHLLKNNDTEYQDAIIQLFYDKRRDFLLSMPSNKTLEIGPFTNLTLIGKNVKYFDVLDFPELVQRAKKHSYPVTHYIKIDYVSSDGGLKVIGEKFNSVFSYHCIEHQINLIKHLNDVADIFQNKGKYYLIIPDKRYCFDYFLPESSVADILGASLLPTGKCLHPANVIKHRAFIAHNDPQSHWVGDHGDINLNFELKISSALKEIHSRTNYIDVHAWQFPPISFRKVINTLNNLTLNKMKGECISNTPFNTNEFCAILSK